MGRQKDGSITEGTPWPDEMHEHFMHEALKEAKKAAHRGEVPVGAILVSDDHRIIARAHNLTITLNDPTAHAEILALRQGAEKTGNYRLNKTRLYVTLEPCAMCAGAMIWARIDMLIFGAWDDKAGACGSMLDLPAAPGVNHRFQVVPGVLAEQSARLLQAFFHGRRQKDRSGEVPKRP